ncbi:hypothetical protein H9P43_005354 [Blastocladiella emersonii ATCC 22665]|nr:hypothetical protein H9P43_005354 [Blastocladiella emersonii ATCC 22665]
MESAKKGKHGARSNAAARNANANSSSSATTPASATSAGKGSAKDGSSGGKPRGGSAKDKDRDADSSSASTRSQAAAPAAEPASATSTTAPDAPAPEEDADWLVGKWVRLTVHYATPSSTDAASDPAAAAASEPTSASTSPTTDRPNSPENVVEGQVYAYDARNGLIVLQCPSKETANTANKRYDLRAINTRAVASTAVIAGPAGSASAAAGRARTQPSAAAPESWPQGLFPVGAINWESSAHREAANIRVMEAKLAKINVGVGRDAQVLFDALSKTMECRWADATIVVMESVLVVPPYLPENCKSNNERALMRLEGERRKLRL